MPELPVAVIERLAFGGNGVCRIDGKVCFVPFSCPGDEVRLNITTQKKSYSIAEISELVSSSDLRTIPACPIFGSCGGCSWQHVSYSIQLEQKRQIFADTLWRGARIGGEVISDVVAALELYGYRSRVQFKVSVHKGKPQIGFFRHGSHSVVDAVEGCCVAVPQINQTLENLRSALSGFPELEAIPHISVDAGEQGIITVVQYIGRSPAKISSFLLERSSDLMPCSGLFLLTGSKSVPERLWGDSKISYVMPGRDPDVKSTLLTYRPGGFAQVNQSQNIALLSIIRQFGKFRCTDDLLDLYCGNGNFSLPLAAEVVSVTGVDGTEDSIISAEYNRVTNQITNAEFVCDDVRNELRRFVRESRKFDIVLLDPPRAGAADCVSDIVRLAPDRIIYVSCDPATLARDCALLADGGYRIAESVPVDMFPQTYHLESVTLLVK